jgi:phage regulator Rha-like protein
LNAADTQLLKNIKSLKDFDKSLTSLKAESILDLYKGVYFQAQRHVQRYVELEKKSKDKKLLAAKASLQSVASATELDNESGGSSDGSSDGSCIYYSDSEYVEFHNNGDILMELSVGDTIMYGHIVLVAGTVGSRLETIIRSIKDSKVILADGYTLQPNQEIFSKDFSLGQELQNLYLNEGGDATAASFYTEQGREWKDSVAQTCVEYLRGEHDHKFAHLLVADN